jgi:glycosyltransferase involved in cell wall biosynthesis
MGKIMSVWVQIPCFNEESTIFDVLREIPEYVGEFKVNVLVIDDGSIDNTVGVVRLNFPEVHIVMMGTNHGLARAFQAGVEYCIQAGARVIVNTDGDGQYLGEEITDLILPILNGQADVVIGTRKFSEIDEFSFIKKQLQRVGSKVVSLLTSVRIEDATSGFRGYRATHISEVVINSRFSYTLESLVQLSFLNARIMAVPISRRNSTRKSRLFSSNLEYIRKNGATLLRTSLQFRPFLSFGLIGVTLFFLAIISWLPYLVDLLDGQSSPHLQSVIVGGVLMVGAIVTSSMSLIADAILQIRIQNNKSHAKNITNVNPIQK